MMMVIMIGQSRGKVVFRRCLIPDGSISGSGHNDSVFVNADDLYDFRQMCTPEHNLINHTAIIRKLHDVYFTAKNATFTITVYRHRVTDLSDFATVRFVKPMRRVNTPTSYVTFLISAEHCTSGLVYSQRCNWLIVLVIYFC